MRVLSKQAFTAVIRAGDSRRFSVNLKKDRDKIIDQAVQAANAHPASLPEFHSTTIKGKPCVSYSEFSTHLILRSIAKHIHRRYRVKLPNRDTMVRGVIESLFDSTPMHVLRRDISSFYETIPNSTLRNKLLYDTASSAQVRAFIRAYFDQHCANHQGLPRGVGLSAVLAELAMEPFDTKIREISGVYKYYRYSDDILIFSFLPVNLISNTINGCLPDSMEFNTSKSFDVSLACTDKLSARQVDFDYLGYRFSTSSLSGQPRSRKVVVSISDKKIKRLKTRIILSLRDFARTANYGLLKDRLRFLTGNYAVRRHGVSHLPGSSYVMSGIYFNYRLAGIYEFNGRQYENLPHSAEELKRLDGFLNSLLKSRSSEFSRMLSAPQQSELSRFSFYQGFSKKIVVRYDGDRIHDIKRAWVRHG